MAAFAISDAIRPYRSVSAKIVETCAALESPIFWMPTGTETNEALEICQQNGVTAIHCYCPLFLYKLFRTLARLAVTFSGQTGL